VKHFATSLVHPERIPGEPTGATSTPIYQTATFELDLQSENAYDYSRSGNPTRRVLEEQLRVLDRADRSLVYGSGVTAIHSVLRLLKPGSCIAVSEDLYGGTQRLLRSFEAERRLRIQRVETSDAGRLLRAIEPQTAMLLLELPTNPNLHVPDVRAIADGLAGTGTLLAVDHSMLSSYLVRPLESGADIAIQSATKALGGHGDLTAGVVSTKSQEHGVQLAFNQNAEGTALGPSESWLLLRGMQTLAVRMDRAIHNAHKIIEHLRSHDRFGTVITARDPRSGADIECPVFALRTGCPSLAEALVQNTELFQTTVSFGSVKSSVCLPLKMSHLSASKEERERSAITGDLLRFSVGIEDAADLTADLDQALLSHRRRQSSAAGA
jgi:cystathionine beta-lyase